MTGVKRLVAAAAALGVLMTASAARPDESAVHQVSIAADSFLFAPQALSISQGDRVRWSNNDTQMHMIVTAKPESNGKELEIYHRLDPGTSFEHQFTNPTAYYYYCAIHFQMWGIISVNP
ncbi:MAG: plastocyanin/azurin family copper-binding protein [Nitrospirota bacterium]